MSIGSEVPSHLIPLWIKIGYTLFLCVLVPYYWVTYGPTNFLYFCDVALFLVLAALWLENSLLASMAAVGIIVPQLFWLADFLAQLAGWRITGISAYMFKDSIPLAARALSLFHGWLPLLVLWLVWRLGYDGRAFWAWTVLAWLLLLVCYFCLPAPPAPLEDPHRPVNVNYVYGPSDDHPQTWMPPILYLVLLMILLPLVFFLPAHLVLRQCFAGAAAATEGHSAAGRVDAPPQPGQRAQDVSAAAADPTGRTRHG